VEIPCTKI